MEEDPSDGETGSQAQAVGVLERSATAAAGAGTGLDGLRLFRVGSMAPMTNDAGSEFDFNAQAKALLKRVSPVAGGPPTPALALAAVEAALREAFRAGKESAGQVRKAPAPSRPLPAQVSTEAPTRLADCDHEWEETFLDGRALGYRCLNCGVLQRDVQEQCNHYFVDVDGAQVCVACRKARKKTRG